MCVLPLSAGTSEPRSERALGPTTTAATSTTPSGLLALFLASAGTFLLPILLSAAQLAVSRRWPDSDVPRDLERIKVIVNVAGAAATSIVAVVKRWRLERATAAAEAMAATAAVGGAAITQLRDAEANETTGLLTGGHNPSYSKLQPPRSPEAKKGSRHVMFDAELIDINMKEDQAQMAVVLPVT